MPMILVKKNPRGKVIRELSSEEETAVKTVCGLKKPATVTNGAIVIHTQRLKSDPGGNLLS